MIRHMLLGPAARVWARPAIARVDPTALPVSRLLLGVTGALAPAYVIRWHIGPLPTTLLEVAVLVTAATFVVESVRARHVPDWRSPLTLPAVLFLAAGAIAVLVSPSRLAGLGIYRAYLVEPLGLALVVASAVRREQHAYLVLAGLWLGGCVLALANAALVLEAVREHRLDVRVPAPVAIYLNPNAVALYLVPLLAVAGGVALHARSRAMRLLGAGFVAVALPASVLTFSRGGWIAIAAVTAGLALTHRRRWWMLAALACGAAAVAAVPEVAHRALLLLQQGAAGNTGGDRLRLWALTVQLLQHRPLTGTGLAGFEPTAVPLWHDDATWIIYPHNLVLDLWAETGLLGLLTFAWAFAVAVAISWRAWRRPSGDWRAIHLGVLLALLGVLVHGMVDNPYFKNDLSVEYWLLVAISWVGWRWGAMAIIPAPPSTAGARAVPAPPDGERTPQYEVDA